MTVYDVVAQLTGSGLKLRVSHGNLNVSAPKGAMTPALAQLIGDHKDKLIELFEGIHEKSDIPVAETKDYYALSFVQRRMYFLQEFDKASVAYNMPEVVRLEGEVDETRLEDTFRKLIARHESLRTSFRLVDEAVVQCIAAVVDFQLERYTSDDGAVPDVITSFVRPFDLRAAPLIRVGLITLPVARGMGQAILLVDMHHIISDGVSRSVLMRDFMQLYNGAALAPLTIQYKDYAEWQQHDARQEQREKQRTFWLEQYATETDLLALPTDFSRPRHRSYAGASVRFTIGAEESNRLKAIAHAEGMTLYMIILAVYTILLAKVCNQEDIVVGTPTAGRQHAALEGVMGMFVNTLCLRHYPSGIVSFKQFLRAVKENTLACFDHQDYQYDALIEDLKLARDAGRNPLFDVMFSYQNMEEQQFQLSGLTLTPVGHVSPTSKFDLTLRAGEGAGALYFNFEYATELFKESTIERFVAYFGRIIQAITADPEIVLRDMDVLSTSERDRLLLTFNDTRKDFPGDATVVGLFEDQAARTPHAVALGQDGRQWSYQELNERANQVAHFLTGKGVGTGSIVGLMIGRSMEMVVGILGILKTGAAYLPLNGDVLEGRNLRVMQESGASVLLTEAAYLEQFKKFVDVVDVRDAAIQSFSRSNLGITVLPTSLAYILYTSGSTGNPKGVLIGHRSIVNMAYSQRALYEIDARDTILLFSTITFDPSVQQMWLALLFGAKLVTVDTDVLLNATDFNRYLPDQHITHLHVTPSFLDVIDVQHCPLLRRVVLGGEAFKVHSRHQHAGSFDFYNSYGPTENTVTSVSCKVPAEAIRAGRIAIGRPLANVQAYVLGRLGELLPEGSIGELYLSGEGLAHGYLNDAVLTNDKFVRNPFIPGTKMYKTGDFVRWLPDGQLEFIGRIDDQVKIRGYRIELGEISGVLQRYEGIREVLVVAKDHAQDKCLVAYYVSAQDIAPAVMRNYLLGELPDYMVPGYYVRLEKIPLTPNGKIHKAALPNPVFDQPLQYEMPSNETEEKLVAIWSEVLKLDAKQISVTGNFFDMGGHSLKAIQIVAAVFRELKSVVTLRDVFNHPTIRELSGVVVGQRPTGSLIVKLTTMDVDHEDVFFIPPVIGSSTVFRDVAITLRQHYNVYGIQYRGFDDGDVFDGSIEAMAETFVGEIKRTTRNRSISLIGYSMGVPIAFEMAKILERDGYNLKLVFIDRGVSGQSTSGKRNDEQVHQLLEAEIARWVSEVGDFDAARIRALVLNNYQVLDTYQVSGSITSDVFAIEALKNYSRANMNEWKKHSAGDFSHVFMEADHYGMLEARNAVALGEFIAKGLFRAVDVNSGE
jgi:amino acid adenylation domain-containing protein